MYLFRGKRVDNKEWAESQYPFGTIHSGVVRIDFIHDTIGQYIRKTDLNGKKIFEGDIMEYDFETIGRQRAVIIFSETTSSFVAKPLGDFQYTPIESGVVIGNIFDNADLFQKKIEKSVDKRMGQR